MFLQMSYGKKHLYAKINLKAQNVKLARWAAEIILLKFKKGMMGIFGL